MQLEIMDPWATKESELGIIYFICELWQLFSALFSLGGKIIWLSGTLHRKSSVVYPPIFSSQGYNSFSIANTMKITKPVAVNHCCDSKMKYGVGYFIHYSNLLSLFLVKYQTVSEPLSSLIINQMKHAEQGKSFFG